MNRLPRLSREEYTWGTDGYLPYNQVDSIIIRLDSVDIPIENKLYTDLFNVQDETRIYKIKNFYIVHHKNSDGAGTYEIAWVLNENGIQQRIVGSMY